LHNILYYFIIKIKFYTSFLLHIEIFYHICVSHFKKIEMKRLPLGIQTFSQIVNEHMVYVDKTMYIKELIDGYKYVFLSRPRRFGKSLFVSTLGEFFKGNRELFKGLAIDGLIPDKWEAYPVLKLDFSSISSGSTEELGITIKNRLEDYGDEYGVEVTGEADIEYFPNLVKNLYRKFNKPVVILIDEYDKPIVDNLGNVDLAEKNKLALREFYSVIKSLDEHIKFMFVTGVSKFTKVSLFSGLNQISEITFNKKFVGICGYDQKELEFNFDPNLEVAMTDLGVSRETILDEVKKWYNGYSWDGELKLYNPFSVLSFFDQHNFQTFWYNTGTPYFLVDLIKREKFDITASENLMAVEESLSSDDLENLQLKSLLFQTGYLTIKKKVRESFTEHYILDFPNYEVKSSFNRYLFAGLTNNAADITGIYAAEIKIALQKEDYETFLHHIRFLFAKIPSNLYIAEERYFHSLFIMIAALTGIDIESEVNTNIGRIDGVLEFMDKIYLIEFKFNKSTDVAVEQIKKKRYSEKYETSGKKIIHIGMNFTREGVDIKIGD
jgi:hypothetical protein